MTAPALRWALSMLCSRLPRQMHLLSLALSIRSEGAGVRGRVTAERADFNVPGEMLKIIGAN